MNPLMHSLPFRLLLVPAFLSALVAAEPTRWSAFGEAAILGAPAEIRQGTELQKARYLTYCFAQELAAKNVEPNNTFGGRFAALFKYGAKRSDRGACMDIEDSMIEVLRGAGFRHTAPVGVVGFKGGLADYNLTDVNRTHVGLGVVCDGQIYVFDPWQYGLAHKAFAGMSQQDPWNGMTLDAWLAAMRTQGYTTFKVDSDPPEVLDAARRTRWVDADNLRKEQDRRMARAQQEQKAAKASVKPTLQKFSHPGFSPELFIQIPADLALIKPPLNQAVDQTDPKHQRSGIPRSTEPAAVNGISPPLYPIGEQSFDVSPYLLVRDAATSRWKSDDPKNTSNDTRRVRCDVYLFIAESPEAAKLAGIELGKQNGFRLQEGFAYTEGGERLNFISAVGSYVYYLVAEDGKNDPKAYGIATELKRVLEQRLKQRTN